MPSKRLTAAAVDKLAPPASGRIERWDALVPGLGLRVTDKGVKSWTLLYRVPGDGRKRRMTLGRYPALGLTDARQAARDALGEAREGRDPARRVRREAQEAAARDDTTVRAVAEDFLERYRRPRNTPQTYREAVATWRNHVYPALGEVPLHEVRRRDVVRLLDRLAAGPRPSAANKAAKELRRLFAWALDRDLLETNPLVGLGLPVEERFRERVLSDAEVAALWAVTHEVGYPFGPLYRVLLLTGQRRDEAARMRREDLDLAAGVWTIPRELSKSDRAHAVPLAPAVVAELAALPAFTGPYVFSTSGGERPVSGFSRAKRGVDARLAARLGHAPAPWRVHDLRRTAASGLARAGVAPEVIGRVLNHAPGGLEGVTAVYNRYGYEPEKRRALAAWADHVAGLVGDG